MALLWMDGFDHYSINNTTFLLVGYSFAGGNGSTSSTSGRVSGSAYRSYFVHAITKPLGGNKTTVIAGFALKPETPPSSDTYILRLLDSGTVQTSLYLNTDGTVSVRRSTTTVLATSTATIPNGVYSYIEFKATCDNASGAYEVRVNGVNILSGTGVDTQQTTNAYYTHINIGQAGSNYMAYDDFYVLDTSGSTNNDFLGDCRVDTVLPDTDGNYSQFTPSTGSTHYVLVDENPPNTTDYNSSATATNKDSYGLAALPTIASQTIFGVMVSAYAAKSDAGTRSIKVGMRSGTTDTLSASQSLSVDYAYYHNIHEIDPNTSAAWTESGVNSAELLVENV